jgi:hypothetical protein
MRGTQPSHIVSQPAHFDVLFGLLGLGLVDALVGCVSAMCAT